jgi:protein O-GlcNAc transferase
MFGWLKKSDKGAKSATGEPRVLGQLLREHLAGDLAGAAKGYAKLYYDQPDASAAGFLLATTRIQLGNLAGVRDLLGTVAAAPGVITRITNALKDLSGDVSAAVALMLQVGDGLKQHQMAEEATFYYRVAAELGPQAAEAWYRLGDTLHDFQHYEEARHALTTALTVDPDHWAACYTFAVLLQDVGCDGEAIGYYLHALELREDHAKSHNNLGSALLNTGHLADAVPHFARAVELDPNFGHAQANLGTVLNLQGKYYESLAALEQASALGAPAGNRVKHALILPAVPAATDDILEARSRMQRELQALTAQGVTLADPLREVGITPFYLAYHGLNDLPLLRQLAQFYEAACPQLQCTAGHCVGGPFPIPEGSKIRVGFISTFFFDHTIGRYFNQVMGKLSRERFHVTAISNFATADEVSETIRRDADACLHLPMNLATAQQSIADARLDVLVYCDVGMEPLTYFLAFARLAPYQVAFYGHPETTGIPTIDYFLSHQECEPADNSGHYSEKLLLLSPEVAYTYYQRPETAPEPKSREDFELDPGAHLYLCPQSIFKIHPDLDGLFAQILATDPKGQLLLYEGLHPHWNELLAQRLAGAIPDFATRVRFLPRMSHLDFLEVLRLSDVILDPLHFSGGATTLDGLAMGTPVVTLPGAFMRGRQTLACYRRLEIEDCIAADTADYVQKAVQIAGDHELRGELSRRILAAAPRLYEDSGMVQEFENLLLGIVA